MHGLHRAPRIDPAVPSKPLNQNAFILRPHSSGSWTPTAAPGQPHERLLERLLEERATPGHPHERLLERERLLDTHTRRPLLAPLESPIRETPGPWSARTLDSQRALHGFSGSRRRPPEFSPVLASHAASSSLDTDQSSSCAQPGPGLGGGRGCPDVSRPRGRSRGHDARRPRGPSRFGDRTSMGEVVWVSGVGASRAAPRLDHGGPRVRIMYIMLNHPSGNGSGRRGTAPRGRVRTTGMPGLPGRVRIAPKAPEAIALSLGRLRRTSPPRPRADGPGPGGGVRPVRARGRG